MTTLAARIADFIRAHGPLDIGRFMLLCAVQRQAGYYARNPALGADGDFLTAPEISQIFGELIGLAVIAHWRARGAPQVFRLAELGPGNGTLMSDLWRALAVDPDCRSAISSVDLVETSSVLRARQRERLTALPLAFHDAVDTLPTDLPLFIIANEFFDALPLRQFVRAKAGFRERLVTLDQQDRLTFTLAPQEIPEDALADPRYRGLTVGAVVEIAPAREAVASLLADKLQAAGGVAYVIDYGYDAQPAGDTLQAIFRHSRVSPLDFPGEADISAHVDFRALLRAAARAGATTFGPIPQGLFLRRLGIDLRLARLTREASSEVAARLEAGVRRLVDPAAMGELFQVAAIAASAEPVPPGFLETERCS